ncbi:Endonuclease/Exonuclease/phosphatase family [Novymonas esmeraldas]|uniref:Endonuclease/Exonuclease/phosphatase family n=1 Tax=Novymonas esmeraldas TaxID=1808958 RepID=A0AAW0F616_9TRYP
MFRRLALRRFRPFSPSHGVFTTDTGTATPSHTATSTGTARPTTAAAAAAPGVSSPSFLNDPRTEKAQRRWSKENRVAPATSLAASRTGGHVRGGAPTANSAGASLAASPATSSGAAAAAAGQVRRIMQGKNTVVVLHPGGSKVVTLDLSIALEAAGALAKGSQSTHGTMTVTKSMAREESEAAAKTLDRIRLLFAPPRPSGQSSKRVTKDQILSTCPTVRAFCRTADLAGEAEELGPLSAPDAPGPVVLASSEGTGPYTELNPQLPSRVFWRLAQVLRVHETDARVLYNVPTITSVASPGTPYVGLPLACGDVSVLFAAQENVCYEWCVVAEGSASLRSTHHGEAPFRVVGTAPTFTPTRDLLGKALLLRVSLDPVTGLWTELRLPDAVRPLPPPVARWQATTAAVHYPAFRVVTYNILYDDFCTSKSSKAKIYPFATDDILDLENRKVRIVQELLAYHADLVCLQECGRDVFQSYLLPVLRACGYDGVYCNKSGSVKEGCGFLFRTSRFTLVESASTPLHFDTLSRMFPALAERVAACAELKEALSAVTSIGARLVLRETTSGREVVLGNTHLFYHANACHIRILQTYMLLHWLHSATVLGGSGSGSGGAAAAAATSTPAPQRPLILCGDFNCTHPTGAYRLCTTGQVEAEHPSWEKGKLFWWGCSRLLGYDAEHLGELLGEETVLPQATVARKDFKRHRKSTASATPVAAVEGKAEVDAPVRSATTEAQGSAPEEGGGRVVANVLREALYAPRVRLQDAYHRTDPSLPWTNFTLTFREVIDYIFFSEDSLEVLRTVPIPPEEELTENFALPNKKYPSDHVALIADLAFTAK